MSSKSSRSGGRCAKYLLRFLFLAAMLSNLALSNPVSPVTLPSLISRGEINPIWEKFGTKADEDMPGYPEWFVLAKHNLSSWDDVNWALSSTEPMHGMYSSYRGMANGYIGSAVSQLGPYFDKDVNRTNHNGNQPTEGWPVFSDRQTFATIAGFYTCQPELKGSNYLELRKLGCESVIAGIPHFLGLKLVVGGQVYDVDVDLKSLAHFDSKVYYKKGVYDWRVTWSPRGLNISLDIEMTSFVHRLRPNSAGTQLQVTARGRDVNCTIIDIFDGKSAVRSNLGEKGLSGNSSMYLSLHPEGQPNVTAWMVSTANVSNGYTDETSRRLVNGPDSGNNMTIGQEWNVHLVEGKTAIFEKYVGIAATDKFPHAERTAREESSKAFKDGWVPVVTSHVEAWGELVALSQTTNYRDPVTGRLPKNDTLLEKLQIAAIADAFYLLQNLQPAGSGLDDAGVAVGGLTSDMYGGMLFWDQDFWMFPVILAHRPDYARHFLLARAKQLPQSKLNAQTPYVQETYRFPQEAALYSWTAGKFGNATATGPALNYEYHINSDIALAAFWYLDVTGDETFFKEKLWPIVLAVGHTIDTLLVADGDGYSVYNMTDPDEWQNNAKNGAFTLASFSTVLTQINQYQERNGLPSNKTWAHKAANVNIRKADSGITLEYEGMSNNVTVKQADVTLMIHPLNFFGSLNEQWKNLAYYDRKQSPDGPAMTHAISAIAMNRIAKSGCSAFTRQVKAQLPNLRAPWFQMSEQANDDQNFNGGIRPSFPFLTGSGGSLQIPLFGYLGLTPLKTYITIRPALPTPLKHLRIADFHSKGNRFRASMNSTHTNITRLPVEVSGLYDAFKHRPMPLIVERRNTTEYAVYETAYEISLNQTITVENDMYWQQLTVPNNLLQCQPTTSGGQYTAGNPPGAATDGDAGTHWQPLTQNASNITVETSNIPFQRIVQLSFDWGPRTPMHARVAFTNKTDLASICDANPIVLDISPKDMPNGKVALYQGNTTVYNITGEHWSGRYTILEVEGCQGCGTLVPTTFENGTTYWQGDGLGAFVEEFAAVGETGIDLVKNLKEVTTDERQDAKGDMVDSQDAHSSALAESFKSAGMT